MKKLLKALLLIGWMVLIFGLSNQSGASSQDLSDGIMVRVALFICRFKEIDIESFVLSTGAFIRKCAHLFEYFVLYILSYECFRDHPLKNTKKISLLFCIFFAFFDEFHQLFIDGRSGQLSDCFIDGLGSLCAFLLWHKIHKE